MIKSGIVLILIMVLSSIVFAFGMWFLQGGDIRELLNGCFEAKGC